MNYANARCGGRCRRALSTGKCHYPQRPDEGILPVVHAEAYATDRAAVTIGKQTALQTEYGLYTGSVRHGSRHGAHAQDEQWITSLLAGS